FDQLRRALACKRYEQPPPGYFHHFSHRVIARIEVEEFRGCSNWWDRLMEKLEPKHILACACGMAVSSLLLVGFRFSEILDPKMAQEPLPGRWELAGVPHRN